ncbi:MAG TPA: hypothetical protein VIM14_11635 [Polyangia bacterium]
MLTALLLGAGASRELGMPLRADISAEILAWLSPTSLRKLNATWRSRGFGHPDEVIEDIAGTLDPDTFDYEALLGHLQAQYLNDAREGFAQAYHALYAWLAQVVSQLLYRRQVERRDSYREGLQYFEGIARLAQNHRPLWIFSLNHDVLIECIAALFGIEVNGGFSPRTVFLPCRSADGQPVAALAAETLTDAELASGQLPFFKSGWPGINLLKVHGALDVFTHGDGHDLLRLKPEDQTFDAIIDALQMANEGLLDPNLVSSLVPDPLALANQIPYIDSDGQPQVLGRTLLASAARLTDPYPPLMQRRLLEYFRASLAEVGRLVAIGYGMGDADINDILGDWLAASITRQLEIVAPGIAQLPSFLQQLSAQVELTPASATTYLERVG